MALLNNIYILVTEESVERKVEIPSHPTESGLPLSDTVREEPFVVNLSGKIVDVVTDRKTMTAKTIINKIKAYQKEGALITYVGQCGKMKHMLIQSFNANFNHKNFGGANFDLSMKEVRTAKKAYIKEKVTKIVKPVTETSSKPKVGDTVFFEGGNVFVSSDALKPSANRNACVCRLTKISTLANRKHIYHIISTDLRDMVYGWVDEKKVRKAPKKVGVSSNGGNQQLRTIK